MWLSSNIEDRLNVGPGFQTLDLDSEAKLREELDFISLIPTWKWKIFSISLSSGITVDLLEKVVKNVHLLTLVEKIEASLPVYSRGNATAICNWEIVRKFIRTFF